MACINKLIISLPYKNYYRFLPIVIFSLLLTAFLTLITIIAIIVTIHSVKAKDNHIPVIFNKTLNKSANGTIIKHPRLLIP